jgi:hypothetical protein
MFEIWTTYTDGTLHQVGKTDRFDTMFYVKKELQNRGYKIDVYGR